MAEKNNPNELYITRVYDAPVDVVWDAWTDPNQAAKWWGPRGFTITTHSKELKVGGIWHYTMHGPDGTDYPNKTLYHEIEEGHKLVYDHGGNDEQAPLFRVTVLFHKLGNKTEMEMTMRFTTAEEAKEAKKFIKLAGGHSTWDRLAEYLESTESNREVFVINRSFNAPIETIFNMWVDPKHFSQWLGPDNCTMEFLKDDIAVGKTTFYKMSHPDFIMYGKMNYLKIEPYTHLEYTQIFCDENGELIKHPGIPTWPDELLTQVLFTKESNNQTRVTVLWEPHGDYSEEELKTFLKIRPEITQGWTQSFDKINQYLKITD